MWSMNDKQIPAMSTSESFTFLARGVDFKGVISFDGTIRIDGRLEGEVHTTGTVIVGEHALIKGSISAGVLTNSGKVKGTVTATEKVQILKHGALIGDIHTPGIVIEEGGHFHGMCEMGAHKWVEEEPSHSHSDQNVPQLTEYRDKAQASGL